MARPATSGTENRAQTRKSTFYRYLSHTESNTLIENVRVPAVPVPLLDVILGNFCICRYLRTTGTVLIQNSTAEPKQNLSNS